MSALAACVCFAGVRIVGRQNVHVMVHAWTNNGEAGIVYEPPHPISDTSTVGIVWPREHAAHFAAHVEAANSELSGFTVGILIEQWQRNQKVRNFVSRPSLLDHTGVVSSLNSKRFSHMQSSLRTRLRQTVFALDFVDDQTIPTE